MAEPKDHPESALQFLMNWYESNCNGDWEHAFGVKIETLDNSGWRVVINLSETPLQDKPFERIEIERSEHDWVHAWISKTKEHIDVSLLEVACGPLNLEEALRIFREFAQT